MRRQLQGTGRPNSPGLPTCRSCVYGTFMQAESGKMHHCALVHCCAAPPPPGMCPLLTASIRTCCCSCMDLAIHLSPIHVSFSSGPYQSPASTALCLQTCRKARKGQCLEVCCLQAVHGMWWCLALDALAGQTGRSLLQLGSHGRCAAGVRFNHHTSQHNSKHNSQHKAAGTLGSRLLLLFVSACGVYTCSCTHSIYVLCPLCRPVVACCCVSTL